MAKSVRIIDSSGSESRMKLKRVLEHHTAGSGEFHRGTFYFRRASEVSPILAQAGLQADHRPSLADRLSALPCWPDTDGRRYTDGVSIEGFLPYPQPSLCTAGLKYAGIANFGK